MANHEIKDPKQFSIDLRILETTDPAHADTFNPLYNVLLNNEAYLEEKKLDSADLTREKVIEVLNDGSGEGGLDADTLGGLPPEDYAKQTDLDNIDMSGKVDKPATAVTGNLAAFDGNKNVVDTGKKVTDFALKAEIPTSLPANGGTSAACSGNAATATKAADSDKLGGVAAVSYARKTDVPPAVDISGKLDKLTDAKEYSLVSFDRDRNIRNSGLAVKNGALVDEFLVPYIESGMARVESGAIAVGYLSPQVRVGLGSLAIGVSSAEGKYCAGIAGGQSTGDFCVGMADGFAGGWGSAGVAGGEASGRNSFAAGNTISFDYQTTLGRRNIEYRTSEDPKAAQQSVLIVGGSEGNSTTNAFRVRSDGNVFGQAAFNATGADFAEYYEWKDGNPDLEDRAGLFVAIDGEKTYVADESTDLDDVLGIYSALPSIVGDAWEDSWNGMFLKDEFGRIKYETLVKPEYTDDNGVIHAEETVKYPIMNPDYDENTPYIPRSERKEWDAIGTKGKLAMIDDGTCQVNKYCKPGKGGIATHSDEKTLYRVMSRVDDTHIRVLIK